VKVDAELLSPFEQLFENIGVQIGEIDRMNEKTSFLVTGDKI